MNRLSFLNEAEDGTISFDTYFGYLRANRNSFVQSVRDFALDESRYELNGPKTLHDSWVVGIGVDSGASELAFDRLALTIRLLLATHETILSLRYFGVSRLELPNHLSELITRKADLIVHEFTADEAGAMSHSLRFSDDSIVCVLFEGFEVSEQVFARN